MKVGVTGHQKRRGLDWDWVIDKLHIELHRLRDISRGYSSLAAGADQVFATIALDMKIPITAVIPLKNYERFFRGQDLVRYEEILARCDQVLLLDSGSKPEEAFLNAGHYIADHCDVLFAVWDGRRAEGTGGTGDIVDYACQIERQVILLDPFQYKVTIY